MPSARNVRYRRSPHVVCFWQRGQCIAWNCQTKLEVVVTPFLIKVLGFFDHWRSTGSLCRYLDLQAPEAVQKIVDGLVVARLLLRSDRAADHREQAAAAEWRSWTPEAALFHFGTRDLEYVPDSRLAKQRPSTRPPPHLKRYPGFRRFELPPFSRHGELAETLLRRRTWRAFGGQPLTLHELAELLGLTWGVQQWLQLEQNVRVPLKTSPSGGARHSIEAYVLARRVDSLPTGWYHFDPDRHCLELLRRGPVLSRLRRYMPAQPALGLASALFVMTAVFGRVRWRYPYSRAYRAVLIEAGHLCQTFCLVATKLGLAPFCTMAFAESEIEKDLRIDGIGESVIYLAGVGSRSAHDHWTPWPGSSVSPVTVPPSHLKRGLKAARNQSKR